MESESEQLVNAVLKWLQTFDFLEISDLSSLQSGYQLATLMAWAAPDAFRVQDFFLALENEADKMSQNWSSYVKSLVHFFADRDTDCEDYITSAIPLDQLPISNADFLPILSATLMACMHSDRKEESINHIFSLEDTTQGLILELTQTAMNQAGILTMMPDHNESPKNDLSPPNSNNPTRKVPEYSREVEQLKAENLMLHQELDSIHAEQKILRDKLESQFEEKLEKQKCIHDNEIYRKNDTIRNYERRCELAEQETLQFEERLHEANDEIRRIQRELTQKDKECTSRIQSMQDDLDMMSKRATKVTILEKKCERLTQKVDQLQMNDDMQQDKIDALKKEKRELSREAKRCEQLEEENTELRQRMTDLRLDANSPQKVDNTDFENYRSERSSLINEKNSLETRLKAALGELEAMKNAEAADEPLVRAGSLMDQQRVASLQEENDILQEEANTDLINLEEALKKQTELAQKFKRLYEENLQDVSLHNSNELLREKINLYESKLQLQEKSMNEAKSVLELKEQALLEAKRELGVHEKEKAQLEIRVEALTQQKATLEVQSETLQIQLQAKDVGEGGGFLKSQIAHYKKQLEQLTKLYRDDRNRNREELKLMSTAYHTQGLEIAKMHWLEMKKKSGSPHIRSL